MYPTKQANRAASVDSHLLSNNSNYDKVNNLRLTMISTLDLRGTRNLQVIAGVHISKKFKMF